MCVKFSYNNWVYKCLIIYYFKVDVDIEFYLQWYDEIQNCFREHTSFMFPKYEPLLLRFESRQAVSNTWRITMDNSSTIHSPLQIKYWYSNNLSTVIIYSFILHLGV